MSWPGAPFSLAPRERTGVQAQLGLSRVREFDAARLTADPEDLARSLTALASGGIWH